MSRASFIQLPPTLFFDAALPVALDPVPVDLADSPPAGGGPPAESAAHTSTEESSAVSSASSQAGQEAADIFPVNPLPPDSTAAEAPTAGNDQVQTAPPGAVSVSTQTTDQAAAGLKTHEPAQTASETVPAESATDTTGQGADSDSPADSPTVSDEPSVVTGTALTPEEKEHVLVVIDQNMTDAGNIRDSISQGVTILEIGAEESGLERLNSFLSANQGQYHDVRIISHGEPGSISLGTDTLNNASIANYQSDLAGIGQGLGNNASIVLYGCNVAQQDDSLLYALKDATGAEIAASNDRTGIYGDWHIEASTNTALSLGTVFDRSPEANLSLINPTIVAEWDFGGHHYRIYYSQSIDVRFQEARAYALSSTYMGQHGYLANITSQAEHNALTGGLTGLPQVCAAIIGWNGFSGRYTWADGPEAGQGSPFTYYDLSGEMNQLPGEPVTVVFGERNVNYWGWDYNRLYHWHSWPNGNHIANGRGTDAFVVEYYIPQAPTITASGQIVDENDGPEPMFAGVRISDADSSNMSGYSLRVENYDVNNARISWTNQAGISVAATQTAPGVMTYTASGTASIGSYQALINSFRAEALGERPREEIMVTRHRILDDQGQWSAVHTTNVLVNEIPDPPTIDAISNPELRLPDMAVDTVMVSENAGPQQVFTSLNVADLDSPNLTSYVIALSGNDPNTVTFTASPPTGISVTIADDAITFTGNAAIALYQQAVASIRVEVQGEKPEQITIQTRHYAYDDTTISPTDPRHDSTGPIRSNTDRIDIMVNEIPDVPEVTITPNPDIPRCDAGCLILDENAEPYELFTEVTIADVDSDMMTQYRIEMSDFNLDELAITATPPAGVSFSYDATGVTFTGLASIADYEAAVRSIRAQVLTEEPVQLQITLTHIVWDDTATDPDDVGKDANGPLASVPDENCITINEIPDVPEVTITPNPDIPRCDAGCLILDENAEPYELFTEVTIADVDSDMMTQYRIEMSDFNLDELAITATPPAGVSFSYDATGVTFTGLASIADYEAAVRSIRAQVLTEEPVQLQITLTHIVWDDTATDPDDVGKDANGPLASVPDENCITINEIPDEPELEVTLNPKIPLCAMGCLVLKASQGPVHLFSAVNISDADSESMSKYQIAMSRPLRMGDIKFYADMPSNLSFSYDRNEITISGHGTVAEYEAAVMSIYAQVRGNDPVELHITMTHVVWDDTANDPADVGKDANGPLSSNAVENCIDIRKVPAKVIAAPPQPLEELPVRRHIEPPAINFAILPYDLDTLLPHHLHITHLVNNDWQELAAQTDAQASGLTVSGQAQSLLQAAEENVRLAEELNGQSFVHPLSYLYFTDTVQLAKPTQSIL